MERRLQPPPQPPRIAKAEIAAHANGVSGFFDASEEEHRRYRRLFSSAFPDQGLRTQEPRIEGHVDLFISALAKHCIDGPVDLVQWLGWVTIDIITDLAFGEPLGCVRNTSSHEWMLFVAKILYPSMFLGILNQWGLLALATSLMPRSVVRDLEENFRYVSHKIEQRVSLGKERGDFFDKILRDGVLIGNDESPGPRNLNLEELKSTANDLVFAGSDTTATLLSGIIFHLLLHSEALRKLSTEIRSIFPTDEAITISSTAHLPYLDAVLQEGLRLYNAAPMIFGRLVPGGGDTVAGVYLPGGTRITIPVIIAFTSERNFARPHDFVPERWLSTQGEEFKDDNPDGIFQPFGSGPRNCLGMSLAKAEMHLILTKLLWHFDLSRPRGTAEDRKRWERWVKDQKVWVLWHKIPLMVTVRKRADKHDAKTR